MGIILPEAIEVKYLMILLCKLRSNGHTVELDLWPVCVIQAELGIVTPQGGQLFDGEYHTCTRTVSYP